MPSISIVEPVNFCRVQKGMQLMLRWESTGINSFTMSIFKDQSCKRCYCQLIDAGLKLYDLTGWLSLCGTGNYELTIVATNIKATTHFVVLSILNDDIYLPKRVYNNPGLQNTFIQSMFRMNNNSLLGQHSKDFMDTNRTSFSLNFRKTPQNCTSLLSRSSCHHLSTQPKSDILKPMDKIIDTIRQDGQKQSDLENSRRNHPVNDIPPKQYNLTIERTRNIDNQSRSSSTPPKVYQSKLPTLKNSQFQGNSSNTSNNKTDHLVTETLYHSFSSHSTDNEMQKLNDMPDFDDEFEDNSKIRQDTLNTSKSQTSHSGQNITQQSHDISKDESGALNTNDQAQENDQNNTQYDPIDPNSNPDDPNNQYYDPNDPNYNPDDPNYDPNDPNNQYYDPNDPNYNPDDPNYQYYDPDDPNYQYYDPDDPNNQYYDPNDPNNQYYDINDPNNQYYDPNDPNYIAGDSNPAQDQDDTDIISTNEELTPSIQTINYDAALIAAKSDNLTYTVNPGSTDDISRFSGCCASSPPPLPPNTSDLDILFRLAQIRYNQSNPNLDRINNSLYCFFINSNEFPKYGHSNWSLLFPTNNPYEHQNSGILSPLCMLHSTETIPNMMRTLYASSEKYSFRVMKLSCQITLICQRLTRERFLTKYMSPPSDIFSGFNEIFKALLFTYYMVCTEHPEITTDKDRFLHIEKLTSKIDQVVERYRAGIRQIQ